MIKKLTSKFSYFFYPLTGFTLVLGGFILKTSIDFPREINKEIITKGWTHFTSTKGDFTAIFPSKPSKEQKQLEIPQVNQVLDYEEIASRPTRQDIYSISALELPKKWMFLKTATILDGALTVLIGNISTEAELLSKEFTRHGSYSAIDYQITLPKQTIQGRLILVGRKLFKIEISSPENSLPHESGMAFIQSFQPIT